MVWVGEEVFGCEDQIVCTCVSGEVGPVWNSLCIVDLDFCGVSNVSNVL